MKRSMFVCLGEDAVEVDTLAFEARGTRRSDSFAYRDGWGRMVIRLDYAKQRKGSDGERLVVGLLNDFDFLLWVNDFSRMGGIRFHDDMDLFHRPSGGKRETPTLIQLQYLLSASKAVEENTETARNLEYLRGNGTSLV